MKRHHKEKIYRGNVITAALIAVVLFVSVCLGIIRFRGTDFNLYDNEVRLLVAREMGELEKGIYEQGKYPYIVFGLDGKVLYTEAPFEYKAGDKVNPQEMLQFDKSFAAHYGKWIKESFVLQKDGITWGFAVFLIPENEIMKSTSGERMLVIFIPVILGFLLACLLLLIRGVYCSRCILKPLREISDSAKAIIRGNYDLEVLRIYEKEIGENEVGELLYSFELMRDELKLKQIREEGLKKSQQELISCISHDLKTPISTIKAYSEGLRDGIAKSEEGKKDYVSIIIKKTDLLIGMINELLEYSNAQLNQLEINPREVYFYEYFYPVMKELKIFVNQQGADFSYEVLTPDAIVCIDTGRITEVMYNLVENSLKYMGEKKSHIRIAAEREGGCVRIKVKDNGIGIHSNDIPYVFDKFYRAEKSRSSHIPGSGLGLSICKYIIKEHGGDIYCKSRHKEGCEIGFTIR